MPASSFNRLTLSDRDLDFLIDTVSPDVHDTHRLKEILGKDDDFRNSFIGDARVFQRVIQDSEVLLRISPALFFEILLRKAHKDLQEKSYTLEKAYRRRIPVFDANELVSLLSRSSILTYLAKMLSSFTKVESYALLFKDQKGIWKKIRFNDMDIDSLIRFSEVVEEAFQFGLYKRIGDVCLFMLGIFPEHIEAAHRYPLSGEIRPDIFGKPRRSEADYAARGQEFYQRAASHPVAAERGLSETFHALSEKFDQAKKPLNFIVDHYLHDRRRHLFG
jgi:hypothetical protein